MREIKFRGKKLDDGKWVYGDLLHEGDSDAFISERLHVSGDFIQSFAKSVDPETVGQFTGIDGICESDIIQDGDEGYMYVVSWDDEGAWCASDISTGDWLALSEFAGNCTVIGNIHDNLELLEIED